MAIAIITDFGWDIYPGLMKSAIRSIDPKAEILDIAHDLPPQDVKSAAYLTRAVFRRLPSGTVILVVVDPGVGTERRILVVEAEARGKKYYFVVPDNGLISVVYRYIKDLVGGEIRTYALRSELMRGTRVSRTFHGRDLFAPLAAKVNKAVRDGVFDPDALDLEPVEPKLDEKLRIELAKLGRLQVAFIDRFGDMLLNSLWRDPFIELDKREELMKHDRYVIRSLNGSFIARSSRFYDPKLRLVLTVGSRGLLEIARPYGNASKVIGEVDYVEVEPL